MLLRHPFAFSRRRDDDQPRTVTYYAPRQRPVDPRSTSAGQDHDHDVRELVGDRLPAGFDWAPQRPTLTLIHGGDPTAPGPDEIQTRIRLRAAIARWGVTAA